VREAIFSILGERVDQAVVLDLFAGSGALGMECLSRGAQRAEFVEKDRRACGVIEANLAKARLDARARVVARDAAVYLKRASPAFDLVFADPPYTKRNGDTDFAGSIMADENLRRVIAADGMVVLETLKGHVNTMPAHGWELLETRRYGETEVSFFLPAGAVN
jgi:16S rRNA (guanine966-N2)-methyltransferase